VRERKIYINEREAAIVGMVFDRFLTVGSATAVARSLAADNIRTRRGNALDKGAIYKILLNRIYIGDAVHKGTAYPGEHRQSLPRKCGTKSAGP